MKRVRSRSPGGHSRVVLVEPDPVRGPGADPLPCIKVEFSSEDEAAAAARGKRPPQYPYRCPMCKQWHLTKQPQKGKRAP